MKKRCDSKPVYTEKYLKTQIKSYEGKINTTIYGDKVSKEDSRCIYLSVVLIDSVLEQVKSIILKCF